MVVCGDRLAEAVCGDHLAEAGGDRLVVVFLHDEADQFRPDFHS